MKRLVLSALNYVCFMLLLILTANSLNANWRLDIIWNIFYARVQSNLFYLSHASSILSVCFVAIVRIIQARGQVARWTLALFGLAAIHEFALLYVDYVRALSWSGMSLNYAIWLGSFVVLGLFCCTFYQKSLWAFNAIGLLIWYNIGFNLGIRGTIDPTMDFTPTVNYHNFVSNATEVLTWIIPSLTFLLPERWILWKKTA